MNKKHTIFVRNFIYPFSQKLTIYPTMLSTDRAKWGTREENLCHLWEIKEAANSLNNS